MFLLAISNEMWAVFANLWFHMERKTRMSPGLWVAIKGRIPRHWPTYPDVCLEKLREKSGTKRDGLNTC